MTNYISQFTGSQIDAALTKANSAVQPGNDAASLGSPAASGSVLMSNGNGGTEWTIAVGPKGDTGDTGPAGPQGLKGDTGDIGPAGADAPVVEPVQVLTGTNPTITITGGTIKTWTLTGASTATVSLSDGARVTVYIDDGAGHLVSFSGVTAWQTPDGLPPTLKTTGFTALVFHGVNGGIQGFRAGG